MKQIILSSLFFFCFSQLFGQTFTEIIKSTASDRASGDQYGYAVDISGDFAVVGAYSDDFGSGQNRGSVYIYKKVGYNDWTFYQKITSSDQQDYDRFGWSVAIDGDYLVVGAYREDDDASGNNTLSNAGSAYIFEKNISGNWVQVQKIVASDRAIDDEFAYSVSLSGTTAVIGARAEDNNVAGTGYIYSAGSVYIFDRNISGVWNQTQKIVASDRAADLYYPGGYSGEDLGDQFGWSVGVSGDYLVVGALHHDYGPSGPPSGALWSSGAAYVFERTGMTWNQVQKIQGFDRDAWDRFGCAVAIDSNVVVVGAYSEDEVADGVSGTLTNPGSAYLFERNISGTWVFTQKIVPGDRHSGDHFGWCFALEDNLLVVGKHSDDYDETNSILATDAGSAYVFQKNTGVWTQVKKMDASDRVTLDEFGVSVGLSNHTIIVGTYLQDFDSNNLDSLADAGAAYFFSNDVCPVYLTNQTVNLCFGENYTVGSNVYTTAGNYSDLFVTVAGCDSTVNTTITTTPEIITNNAISVCYGDGATIGGTYYTTSGTYSAVYSAVNSCDSTVFTTLSVDPEIFSNETISVCFGSGHNIGGTYYTTTGTYPVIYTAVNGCDSTRYVDLIVEPEITSTQNISICYGESYTIGLNTYTTSGVYTDVVSATNFCDSIITTNLTVQLPVNKAIDQNKNHLTALAVGAAYQWMNCTTNTLIVGATNQMYLATGVGSYCVIVTENGCTDTSACVTVNDFYAGLDESVLSNLVTVFPNPNNGTFQITLKSANLQITLINSLGQPVALFKTTDQLLEPVLKLSSGLYWLAISDGTILTYKKIIVNN